MLVLSRKTGESIVVPNCDVTITVVRVDGNRVRLGIEAPASVTVHRQEVWQRTLPGGATCQSQQDVPSQSPSPP